MKNDACPFAPCMVSRRVPPDQNAALSDTDQVLATLDVRKRIAKNLHIAKLMWLL